MTPLIKQKPVVINVGLAAFADNLRQCGGEVQTLQWQPPAEGDVTAGWALAQLLAHPRVEEANRIAYSRYLAAQPVLSGVSTAAQVLPGMTEKRILHSGPPIEWARMCGPQQGAVLGAILFEGWAPSLEDARKLVEAGAVELSPCHHHGAVGPMAGIISPSMPVWIVRNAAGENVAYCNLNEGLGKVLRFGANSEEVVQRLRWMAQTLGPTLATLVEEIGGIELKPLMAQALHMGDEVHNRNAAASALLFRKLTVAALASTRLDARAVSESLAFIASNDHFFLNLSMAACKVMLDAAHGVPHASMVTVMARNGVDFGIRLSGLDQWFVAPAAIIDGLFFPGFGTEDAARDLGDSAITETAGVGGFAMAASPAIVQFIGGTPRDAVANTRRMLHITLGQNGAFTLPALDFTGTPAGIDARRVLDTGIQPVINTGIAHKDAGVGQIGAGITHAPLACFSQAIEALAATLPAPQ
ncbi:MULTISPECIES: DUF1116 domain-containing protein [unclassified Cupriavidus]|uniref:DUF1116 domain-containing protein n=1 Tax=unclassified Cupriavidus TaxID=2640874 RepID=UPI0010F65858|nr:MULTISPECIES: DUF1116 domain-containing protein [unclassified Cupriavidus]MWL86096.1 DUF1116 domain-containing protein [Cupriavidus sp. SW-Y-13]